MSDEPCTCHACIVAGVERPSVTAGGRELHGPELRDWWAARDEFFKVVEALKDGPLKDAARTVLRELK